MHRYLIGSFLLAVACIASAKAAPTPSEIQEWITYNYPVLYKDKEGQFAEKHFVKKGSDYCTIIIIISDPNLYDSFHEVDFSKNIQIGYYEYDKGLRLNDSTNSIHYYRDNYVKGYWGARVPESDLSYTDSMFLLFENDEMMKRFENAFNSYKKACSSVDNSLF